VNIYHMQSFLCVSSNMFYPVNCSTAPTILFLTMLSFGHSTDMVEKTVSGISL